MDKLNYVMTAAGAVVAIGIGAISDIGGKIFPSYRETVELFGFIMILSGTLAMIACGILIFRRQKPERPEVSSPSHAFAAKDVKDFTMEDVTAEVEGGGLLSIDGADDVVIRGGKFYVGTRPQDPPKPG